VALKCESKFSVLLSFSKDISQENINKKICYMANIEYKWSYVNYIANIS